MNPEAQVVLDEILKKDPEALTEEEKSFLRSRRLYLKKAQVEEYKEVLEAFPQALKDIEDKAESYEDILKHARELGYNGKRIKRGELKKFINDKKLNPFN